MAACLFVCLFVWIQPPAAFPPWPSVTNKKHSFLSESPGAFQTLGARRSGGWVGTTSPFLQAPSPGTGTGGWMLLCLPFAPCCGTGGGEDGLASG